jgi:hypothetical protein
MGVCHASFTGMPSNFAGLGYADYLVYIGLMPSQLHAVRPQDQSSL